MTQTKLTDVMKEDYMKITDFDNFFNVYQNSSTSRQEYRFNLNTNLYLVCDDSELSIYECTCYSHWPLISYKIYGTTRLAWLLMKINNVKAQDVFRLKFPGEIIKYLPKEKINQIVKTVNGYT